ncbi:DUF6624 domain-containing protein [Caulobacter endophyticus]|uniref:DUF6624 domain-containing protein n=1 Tax=Caulobacter endophyticus TaxID=2172652 RepID=UPI00240F8A33|nr:DUF6624 domain-containing protein [Caulobacter endophyticus]MDG2529903.1 hypothetical protein [Caulobacter endophyticus]
MIRAGLVTAVMLAAAPALARESPVVAQARADAQALVAREALIEELGGMGAVDQATRLTFLRARKTASPEEREALDTVWARYYKPIDVKHTARLKVLLAGRGWFTLEEVGQRAADGAFNIVNHSPDLAFQKEALAKMEPLVAQGRAPGGYPNLYDRIAEQEGRPQRYATQRARCVDGRHAMPDNVEDPAGLERRRSALGLQTMPEYLKGLDTMYGRCDPPKG